MEFERLFLTLAMIGITVRNLRRSETMERAPLIELEQEQRYNAFMAGFYVAPFLGVVLLDIPILLQYPSDVASYYEFSRMLPMLVDMSICAVVLMMVMPRLQTRFNARTSGVLWMLPVCLIICYGAEPLFVVPLPSWLPIYTKWIVVVWVAGTAAVTVWKWAENWRFRRELLGNAELVTDPEVLSVWENELKEANITKAELRGYRLYDSPDIQTPISIASRAWQTVGGLVFLPRRQYTPEQLSLILRHELVHIERKDINLKIFYTIYSAIFWFNPLMWKMARRSAGELELSCDETVLQAADQKTRREYADLLLSTAGEERGFSSCLSASGSSMRHRLKHVLHPQERATGVAVVAAAMAAVVLCSGRFAVSYRCGNSMLSAPEKYTVSAIKMGADNVDLSLDRVDEVQEFLGALPLRGVAGGGQFLPKEYPTHRLTLEGTDSRGQVRVTLADQTLEVRHVVSGMLGLLGIGDEECRICYRVDEAVDWDALQNILQTA